MLHIMAVIVIFLIIQQLLREPLAWIDEAVAAVDVLVAGAADIVVHGGVGGYNNV
jgi:hypothetical protein